MAQDSASPLTPIDAPIVQEMRRRAREIFDFALSECSIAKAFARSIRNQDGSLWIGDHQYDLGGFSRLAAVSIGKAADSMAEAIASIIPAHLSGIISCPHLPPSPIAGFQYFCGGHPLPNEDSLRAGDAILKFLRELPDRSLVLFLISGGASAMVEKPIDPSLRLGDIVAINRVLVHSGAPIAEINAIRKHLSAIKGGRTAQAAFPRTQVSLLVSDVPDNSLDALASGPTMPDSSTIGDCYAIAKRYEMLPCFPEQIRKIFENERLQETPKPDNAAFANSFVVTLLSNQTALSTALARATALGFAVEVDNSCDDWDYVSAADYLLDRLRALRRGSSSVCLISGGEVTVKVGDRSGIGGRNQQFATYCAQGIAGEPITVLSAGTDGIDGNSPAAGAVVDGTTLARATQRGFDLATSLSGFDAFPPLQAIGDAFIVGPTGNNVRDLRILLAY